MSIEKFTPEYIELCKKLALPREWQPGDWHGWCYRPQDEPQVWHAVLVGYEGEPQLHEPAFWLPTEGDWLDLLEAEGLDRVMVGRDSASEGYDAAGYKRGDYDEAPSFLANRDIGDSWDRLTALARLYCAVKDIEEEAQHE